jgi:uncharacterized protein (DUF1697 family)
MPSRHIALLRGINVGRAKRIAMADLRALMEGLGFLQVRTLLNSGNVVFDVPDDLPASRRKDIPRRIESAMTENLGVSARVLVITAAELDAIIAANPLLDVATDPARLLVAVMSADLERARLAPLAQGDWGADRCAVGEGAVYLWCGRGILDSDLAKAFFRVPGEGMTSRNWSTMLKLQALVRKE